MTGSTGMPSTDTKPTDVVAGSGTSRPDMAAASTTETTRPSAEKILETGTEEVGAPTPTANSPVSPAAGTGTSSGAMGDLARNQGLRGMRAAESFVRENPTASLLAALATGLVLGALLGRSGQGASRRMRDYDYDDERAYQRDYYYD